MVGISVFGRQLNCPREVDDRAIVFLSSQVDRASVVVGFGVLRVQSNGGAEISDRFLCLAQFIVLESAIDVRVSVIRTQTYRSRKG